MNRLRAIRVLAGTVLLEAVRRREIYGVVLLGCGLIGAIAAMDFFGLGGLVKFYREMSLKLMGAATAIAVLLLSTRQLPREFDSRTIYPLLARPIGRFTFLLGKGLGVCAAAAFCYGLFMLLYVGGMAFLGGAMHWGLFLQHVYLQMLMMMVLTSAGFLLSLALSYDAALAIGLLLYVASDLISSASLMLYGLTNAAGRAFLLVLNYALPQLVLFDLSDKAVHGEMWTPLAASVLLALTAYALAYVAVFTAGAFVLFRRRPL